MGKLVDQVESLDHRRALHAAAVLLAERVETSALKGSGTLAQEMAQLRATLSELRALPYVEPRKSGPGGGKVVSADEARLKREARRAAAEAGEVSVKGGRKRRG